MIKIKKAELLPSLNPQATTPVTVFLIVEKLLSL